MSIFNVLTATMTTEEDIRVLLDHLKDPKFSYAFYRVMSLLSTSSVFPPRDVSEVDADQEYLIKVWLNFAQNPSVDPAAYLHEAFSRKT